jgi:osmoprotectant transport system permease protein
VGAGNAETAPPVLFWQTLSYAHVHQHDVMLALRQHVVLSACALGIAAIGGVPLGIWTSRREGRRSLVSVVTALRVVPSLAVLAIMLPILGIGFWPAIVALGLLAFPPILINTDVAFRNIPKAVREAAVGMGMQPSQLLRRIESPLATPVVVAGLRTSTIEVIASATLAAFIGAGGLGTFILDGLANNDMRQLLLGGASVALLALAADAVMSAALFIAARRVGTAGRAAK